MTISTSMASRIVVRQDVVVSGIIYYRDSVGDKVQTLVATVRLVVSTSRRSTECLPLLSSSSGN